MRTLAVVATRRDSGLNRFRTGSLRDARNLRDFLQETGDYSTVTVYELEQTVGPMQKWSELQEIIP